MKAIMGKVKAVPRSLGMWWMSDNPRYLRGLPPLEKRPAATQRSNCSKMGTTVNGQLPQKAAPAGSAHGALRGPWRTDTLQPPLGDSDDEVPTRHPLRTGSVALEKLMCGPTAGRRASELQHTYP